MFERRSWILVSLAVLAAIPAAAAMPPDLGKKDLEEIRGEAIRYYKEKKPRNWEAFVEELKRGGIFLKEELPGIGPSIGFWKCEEDEEGIDLVRDTGPPESGDTLTVQYYVRLVKKNGRWRAVEHSYRELRWQQVPVEDPPSSPNPPHPHDRPLRLVGIA
jgi:hypothetical protein